MVTESDLLRRAPDRTVFWATAILFPTIIFIGFAKSYYLGAFFDAPPFANALVHAHGIIMTMWVIFFSIQITLIRTKNVRVHMTLGIVGVALAILVVVSGLVTAYDSLIIREETIIGISSRSFLIVPFTSLVLFVIIFSSAIYYRKRAFEHKSLMFLTAINFLPFSFSRMSFIPEQFLIPWAFGAPDLIAITVFIWVAVKRRKFNKVFAAGLLLFLVSQPLRFAMMESPLWLGAVDLVAP